MRYYAHYGHKDFVLCLGYRGDQIREYFLNYNECLSNDFVMSEGGRKIELLTSDIQDWRITFVETGLHSNIGQRLLRVREHLDGEEEFLANYADGLTDLPLDRRLPTSRPARPLPALRGVGLPRASTPCTPMTTASYALRAGSWRIGVLDQRRILLLASEIFDVIEEGDELVERPFGRLIGAAACRLPLLGVLAADGHIQGQDHLRSDGGARELSVDDVEVVKRRRCST